MRTRIAIITGISNGIGRETAIQLSKLGINIIGSYLNDDNNAEIVKKEINGFGSECILVKGDIKNESIINKIVKTAIKSYGSVDYLINNASHYERLKIDQISSKQFMDMIKVNMVSPFLLIQKVVPFMKKQKFGKIINISSAVALNGYDYSCHYTSAKSGLIGLTKSLALELAPYIRINCIAPGFINTAIIAKDNPSQRIGRLSKIPLEAIGYPIDVAKLICFLLNDDSNYITGEIIKVSGGY